MTTKVWHRIAVGVAILGFSEWSAADGIHVRYHEGLQQLETQLLAASPADSVMQNDAQRLQAMRFNAFGKQFDLRLTPNRSLLQQLDARQRPAGLGIYRGELQGIPGSWVRLVFDGDLPTGLIYDGEDVYAIERNEAGDAPMVFRLDDLEVPPNTLSCSAISAPLSAAQLLEKVAADVGTQVQSGPGATQNLDIALIGDFEFTSDKGAGNAAAEMITRMNNVDGIFSAQLGVQLTVDRTDTFASSGDPFTDASAPGALLDEVSDFRFSNATQNNNGLTHLFTGRDLDGSTVGVAFTSAICSRRFGAGLTQGTHSVTFDSLIAAHEIGHNFGAPHDGTTGSACESTAQTFLMAPRLNGSDTFSACSISEMQSVVNGASCITALPSTDVAVTSDEVPTTPLLGNLERVSFSVDSVGTNTASNVTVNVTIPGNVTLDSVSATAATCTSGAGTATCSLGDISAGSGSIVSVIATLDAVGNAQFVADITATGDANAANNQQIVNVNVAPAVDLLVTVPAPPSIVVDQSITIRLTMENLASIAATGVNVTISPAAGLRIDSASWPEGSCTLSGGDASCGATNLSAQSSTTITLGTTGTSQGSQSYSVSASANETDRDTANNNANGSVNVGTRLGNPGNDDGGSGSFGGLLLGWLLIASVIRLRRSSRIRSVSSRPTALSPPPTH